jgi:hypothetical protein
VLTTSAAREHVLVTLIELALLTTLLASSKHASFSASSKQASTSNRDAQLRDADVNGFVTAARFVADFDGVAADVAVAAATLLAQLASPRVVVVAAAATPTTPLALLLVGSGHFAHRRFGQARLQRTASVLPTNRLPHTKHAASPAQNCCVWPTQPHFRHENDCAVSPDGCTEGN